MRQHTTPTDSSLELEPGDLAKMLGGAAAGALLMYMLDPDRGSARRSNSTEAIRSAGTRTGSVLGNALHGIGDRIGAAAREAGDAASDLLDDASTGAGKIYDETSARARSAYESAKPNGSARRDLESTYDSASRSVSRAADEASARADAAATRFSRMASQAAGKAMGALHLDDREDIGALLRNPAVVGGGLLSLFGLMRRSPLAAALGVAGLALAARSSGGGLSSLFGGGRGSYSSGDPIIVEKSIRIDASPNEVYDLWSNYENFPRFMSHVLEVRDLGRGRSHWAVQGPAGTQFEFESRLTEQVRGRRLAWRSEPGAEIQNSGMVRLEPYRGGTLATVRLSYTPPAGALGHAVASLLGSDPKRQLDDDLARMKQFIERGAIPHDAARREKSGSRYMH